MIFWDCTRADVLSISPLLGFLLASSPLAASFMGWQGAGGGGAATVGLYYFFGGMLQVIGSLLEWFIGNSFPFVVFGSLGVLCQSPLMRLN